MTPEAQRRALAKWAKWEPPLEPSTLIGWTDANGMRMLSDPLDDLNILHEAEMMLDLHDKDTNVPLSEANWVWRCGMRLVQITGDTNPYRANCAQRLKAILQTIEKWN